MKKLLLFIIILNSCFLTAQKIGADVLKFSGKVTSTVRDSFDVPTGESWLIWNVTTEQFEVGDDTETWGPLMGDGTGAVVSVNGKAGTVVLNPDDLSDASSTNKFITAALLAKLDGIETGAEVNVPSDWNAVSGDARILNKPTLGDLAAKDVIQNTDILGEGINGQVLTTDGAGAVTWENPAGGASSFGSLTGSARDNADLDAELDLKQDALTFDSSPTDSSTNPVESNGIFDALALKANASSLSSYLPLTGGTMNGNINMNGLYDIVNADDISADEGAFGSVSTSFLSGYTSVGTINMDNNLINNIKNIKLTPTDTEPSASKGVVYFDDSEGTLKQYNGTAWEALNGGGTIADGSITTAKLADNAVTSTKILDGTILNADIHASAGIATTKLSTGASDEFDVFTSNGFGAGYWAPISVETGNIVDGTISNADIANGTIEANKLESTNSAVDGYFASYDSATGGVTWESVGAGADSGSGYNFNAISADDYTLDDEDVTNGGSATGKKIWNQFTTGQENIILDKDEITLVGNPFILQNFSSDSTLVKKADGTNFYIAEQSTAITEDGIVLKNLHPVTAIKIDANSFFLQGNITVFNETSASIMTDSNAANPTSEGNNADGFTDLGSGAPTSSATSPILGSYSIVYNAVSASGGEYMAYSLVGKVTNGQSITISFDYIAASTAQLTAWQGLSSTSTKTITADGLQHSYSESVTVSDESTAAIRWYPGTVASAGWKIDNFIITVD